MPVRTYIAEAPPSCAMTVARALESHAVALHSSDVTRGTDVIDVVWAELASGGWTVAMGTRRDTGPRLPTAGGHERTADGDHEDRAAMWVELGRAWINFAFLQHLLEAAAMVDIDHAVIAVVQNYRGPTFDKCAEFLDDVFAVQGMRWPLESVTLIGF